MVVEKSLEAEALALERPRETQLRHISSGSQGTRVLGAFRWRWAVAVVRVEREEEQRGGGGGGEGDDEGEVVYAEGFRCDGFAICRSVAFTIMPCLYFPFFHFSYFLILLMKIL